MNESMDNTNDPLKKTYRALMLDVDGTIMKNADTPSEPVIKAIHRAVAQGCAVSIVSGREVRGFERLNEHLGLRAPVALSNGARIYDPVTKTTLRTQYMEEKEARAIVAYAWETKQPFQVYAQGEEYISEYWHHFYPVSQMDGGSEAKALARKRTTITREIIDILDYASITRIFWDVHVQEVEATRHFLRQFHHIDFSVVRLIGKFYDTEEWKGFFIAHGQATKQHGIVEIGRMLGIDPHEMIGVGDDGNDFPLLMACGLKVAMGNAVNSLKAIADYIAPSVEEDGLVDVIEKFVLAK